MERPSRFTWIAMAAMLVASAAALVWLLSSSTAHRETLGPIRGLRLGMAPAQARERLDTGTRGSFSTIAMDEDFALQWTPRGDPRELSHARMEFHLGQLVALRLRLHPDAAEANGPRLEISEASLLFREPASDAVSLTWLSRNCPTHAGEVRRLLAERR